VHNDQKQKTMLEITNVIEDLEVFVGFIYPESYT
jgi:hypothetical protein